MPKYTPAEQAEIDRIAEGRYIDEFEDAPGAYDFPAPLTADELAAVDRLSKVKK